ncbi:MAG TPA: hypothetical protein VFJ43_09575, partial [Bacteroidia bacterium]|nr:hypothetical protein [Bacteroidia bacterium]
CRFFFDDLYHLIMRVFLVLAVFICNFLSAQKDSTLYTSDFKFKEGIYLNYESFRTNKPIPKSAIIADYSHEELDFIRKIVEKRTISYTDSSGKIQEVGPQNLWGFSENNSIYVRYNADFNKIVVMGSICHFTALYTTYLSTGPATGIGQTSGTPVESMQQYVLDTQTGKILDFILPNMEEILKRDPDLYKEFMAIKKGKRKQLMFIYLRKYNEKHGLYFYS